MEDITILEQSEPEVVIETTSGNDYVAPYSGWNHQVLKSFDLIVSDLPSHYGYIAFEDSGTYYLFYGSQYSKQDDHIYFGSDCQEVAVTIFEDSFTFNSYDSPEFDYYLSPGTLVYSNMISRYPDLKADNINIPLVLGFCLLITSFWAILNRSRR